LTESASPRFLERKPLGETLETIEAITDPPEGFYVIHLIRNDEPIIEDEISVAVLSLHEEDEKFMEKFAFAHGLIPYCSVDLAKEVVIVAREQKPNATRGELFASLEYYLSHDAFLEFPKKD